MQKIFSRSLLMLLALIIISTSVCCAENFVFVDADENTGYYVDMDTVNIVSRDFINVDIAVVKAQSNRMYIYNVKINHKDRIYQINSSRILEYDTRNILESNNQQRPFRPYSAKSEMSELVHFILNGGDLIAN